MKTCLLAGMSTTTYIAGFHHAISGTKLLVHLRVFLTSRASQKIRGMVCVWRMLGNRPRKREPHFRCSSGTETSLPRLVGWVTVSKCGFKRYGSFRAHQQMPRSCSTSQTFIRTLTYSVSYFVWFGADSLNAL